MEWWKNWKHKRTPHDIVLPYLSPNVNVGSKYSMSLVNHCYREAANQKDGKFKAPIATGTVHTGKKARTIQGATEWTKRKNLLHKTYNLNQVVLVNKTQTKPNLRVVDHFITHWPGDIILQIRKGSRMSSHCRILAVVFCHTGKRSFSLLSY